MLDSASEYQSQTDTSSSDFVLQHLYNLRPLPNRRLSATDSSTLNFSALSSNSALRLQTTANLSDNLFSEVLIPTPVVPYVRIPEHFISDHSRPPTPNFADYTIRVDGTTIYDPQNSPRFPILTERFIANTISLSNERKEQEPKRFKIPTWN